MKVVLMIGFLALYLHQLSFRGLVPLFIESFFLQRGEAHLGREGGRAIKPSLGKDRHIRARRSFLLPADG